MTQQLPTLDDLKRYVQFVLCSRADLDAFTPLSECTLYRRGQPCGIEYTLLATRSVRLSAIWEALRNRILFYDQDLTRFQITEVRGLHPPQLEEWPQTDRQVRSLWEGK